MNCELRKITKKLKYHVNFGKQRSFASALGSLNARADLRSTLMGRGRESIFGNFRKGNESFTVGNQTISLGSIPVVVEQKAAQKPKVFVYEIKGDATLSNQKHLTMAVSFMVKNVNKTTDEVRKVSLTHACLHDGSADIVRVDI